jgi:uncharacterized glyoxalase superfamily protein PhnB
MKFIHLIGCAVLTVSIAAACSVNAQTKKEKTKMIDKSTPILHVRSIEPCIKFWTERFGFAVTIQVPEGDHIGFAALENGDVELMYQTYSGMKAAPSNPLTEAVEKGPSFLFMEVPDIQAAIKSLNGAEIVQGLHETFYGAKEVTAKEPGGHFIIFSQLPRK